MIFELFESTTTKIFAVLIFLVLVFSIFLDKDGKRKRFIEYAPTLMTSLGILGTFWGVVLGLLDFDTVNIDRSIPKLLSGLKTAFVTSILGMLAAIAFNALDAWRYADKRDEEDAAQKNIDDSILKQTELLAEIQKGLCGLEESSLISQLKELRTDITRHSNDFDEVLLNKIDSFSASITDGATKLIIESLRSIVNDFNNNLFEQFGSNFKALDSSVIRLLEWQDSYKAQLDLMDEQFKLNEESMTAMAETMSMVGGTIASIEVSCKSIPATMDDLKYIIQTTQNKLGDLVFNLESFVLIRDQAMTAVPQIHEQVAAIGSMFSTSADKLQDVLEESDQRILTNAVRINKTMNDGIQQLGSEIQKGMEALNKISEDLVQGNNKMCDVLEKGSQNIGNELISANNRMRHTLEQGAEIISQELLSSNNKLRNSMENGYQEFQRTTHQSVTIFNETIKDSLSKMELSAEREINRELEQLGAALLQISQGFVNNYDQLVTNYEAAMARQQKLLDIMEAKS